MQQQNSVLRPFYFTTFKRVSLEYPLHPSCRNLYLDKTKDGRYNDGCREGYDHVVPDILIVDPLFLCQISGESRRALDG